MKERDPYLDAEEMAEDASDGELETFMDNIDKKAKSFRSKIIGDAFRELGQSAKQERGKLLDAAASKFAAEGVKELNAAIESINARQQMAQNKFENRVEKLFESHDPSVVSKDVERAVAVVSKDVERELADAVKALRGELADMEKERKKDYAKLTTAMEALESQSEAQFDAKAKAAETPGKWRFTFGRDHFGRIDGEVIATRMTK